MNTIGYLTSLFYHCYAHIKTIRSWPAVCYVIHFVRYFNISLYVNLESVEKMTISPHYG